MSDPLDDGFLEAEVESGIAPLRAMGLSPALLAEAASLLRMALLDHPSGRHLLRRARPHVVQESGPTAIESLSGDDAQAEAERAR